MGHAPKSAISRHRPSAAWACVCRRRTTAHRGKDSTSEHGQLLQRCPCTCLRSLHCQKQKRRNRGQNGLRDDHFSRSIAQLAPKEPPDFAGERSLSVSSRFLRPSRFLSSITVIPSSQTHKTRSYASAEAPRPGLAWEQSCPTAYDPATMHREDLLPRSRMT